MKTISEYQPMIFSQMAEYAERRAMERRRWRADLQAAIIYSGVALWLMFDTGFVLWHWQFWLMFLPFFTGAELAVHAVRSK